MVLLPGSEHTHEYGHRAGEHAGNRDRSIRMVDDSEWTHLQRQGERWWRFEERELQVVPRIVKERCDDEVVRCAGGGGKADAGLQRAAGIVITGNLRKRAARSCVSSQGRIVTAAKGIRLKLHVPCGSKGKPHRLLGIIETDRIVGGHGGRAHVLRHCEGQRGDNGCLVKIIIRRRRRDRIDQGHARSQVAGLVVSLEDHWKLPGEIDRGRPGESTGVVAVIGKADAWRYIARIVRKAQNYMPGLCVCRGDGEAEIPSNVDGDLRGCGNRNQWMGIEANFPAQPWREIVAMLFERRIERDDAAGKVNIVVNNLLHYKASRGAADAETGAVGDVQPWL